jgi:hypothetical protein
LDSHSLKHSESQLAIEYAHRVKETSLDIFVLWLHASSTARFEHSVRDVLDQLKVPGRADPSANIYKLLRSWLREPKGNRKWLLILDNTDDPCFFIEPPDGIGQSQGGGETETRIGERRIDYLPACGHGSLLVTTRSRDSVSRVLHLDDIVEVQPMDEEQACALLEKRLGESTLCDQRELCGLSKRLDHMPLALAQAASYIRERAPRCSVKEYIMKLDRSDRSQLILLSRDDGDSRRDRDARNSILLTWHISFEYIRQTRSPAADLLSLMSFFDRQAIPEALLHGRYIEPEIPPAPGFEASMYYDKSATYTCDSAPGPEPDVFDDDLQMLRSYSFIAVTADPSVFEMHRLVQFAARHWLEANNWLAYWGSHFVEILDNSFPGHYYKNVTECRRLYPHAAMVLTIKMGEPKAVLQQVSVLNKSSSYALAGGAYVEAEIMAKHALHLQTKLLEGDVGKALMSMRLLGTIYHDQRRFSDAECIFKEGLQVAGSVSME